VPHPGSPWVLITWTWENPCRVVVKKMKMRKFSSKIFDFIPLMNIPPMLHTHLPSRVGAICPSEAAIPQCLTHPLNC